MPLMIVLAVLLGVAVCLQGAANGQLSGRIGLPLTLTINSGMVFAGSLLWFAVAHFTGNTPESRAEASWKLYTGGLFGLMIISCAAIAYPRLGAGVTITIAVASQVVTALVLDQLGAAGRQVPISLSRLVGVTLVAVGVWLVARPPTTP
jgi:transporter family-2 protein